VTTTRVRGFAPWSPRGTTLETLNQVQQVLEQYRQLLPPTARQIFYRLVGAYGQVELDLLQRQPIHLEVLCEAAGMVPQLDRVARPYGVPVRSSGGFDSTTTKHDLASFYAERGKPVLVLHVGDLDPSGEHMHKALDEDLEAFMTRLGGRCSVQRVAVTAEQQERFGLATAPPKKTDRRSYDHSFTVQAEALDPGDLAALVRSAIEAELDMAAHAEAIAWQEQVRQQLSAVLENAR